MRRRGFDDSSSPSASLPIRDILFPALAAGRNGAECGPSWPFVRTTDPARKAHLAPFSASLRPLSLTQPNHARFGTVIGTSTDQWVRGSPKERSLEEPPSGEGNTARTIRYRYGPSSSAAFNEPGALRSRKAVPFGRGQGAVLAGDVVHPGAQDLKACWEARSEDMRRKISPLPVRQRHPRLGSALVVLVVAAPPRLGELEPVLVPAPRGEVEELVGPHQGLDATGVG